MSLIGISARFIFLLYISGLKYYSLRLIEICKNYQLKSKFCSNFLRILRYSPQKTEFIYLDPVMRARYAVNQSFGKVFFDSVSSVTLQKVF